MNNTSLHTRCVTGFALILALTATTARAQPIERELTDQGDWQLRPVVTGADNQGADNVTSVLATAASSESAAKIHRARQALAQGQTERARMLADQFIKANKNDPLLSEAYLVRAESLLRQKEYYKSLFDYEYICRTFPGSEAFQIALEQEFEVAKIFAAGKRRKLWGMRIFTAYEEAEELFIRIQERLPGSKLAERAARALADYYYERREMSLAAMTYDVYLTNYPKAPDHAQAMERLVFAHLAGYRGPKFDTTGLEEADGWLNVLRDQHPTEAQQIGADALTDRIEEARADKLLVDARWYLHRNDQVSARFILERLITRHPTSLAAADGYRIMKQHGWIDADSDQATNENPAPAQEPTK